MNAATSAARIIPIVMAGGSGTRLWPISREAMPKQFVSIMNDGMSTFQAVLKRVHRPEFAPPVVVTSSDFRFVVAEQMQALGVEGAIVLEPERRDSAAAVAVGAVIAAQSDPQAVCIALAADHVVTEPEAFAADCLKAADAARTGRIVAIGIKPTLPSTAYGYIEIGAPLEPEGVFTLSRFVEKPTADVARDYIARGFVWNCGNFVFTAQTMLDEIEAMAPDTLAAARAAVVEGHRDLDFLRLGAEAFARAPKISIDYAVMEKTSRAAVIRASFGWSDIGSWDSVYDVKTPDRAGNVLEGNVSVLDTHGSFVHSDGLLTTVLGLDDVVVVSTGDAVLVAAKDKAPRVKDLVSQLANEGRTQTREHLRMHRPWGWYQRIDIGDRFQVKHICVKPGGALSLQRHHHRAEHWIVVHGTAEVTIDDSVKLYHENEAAYLPIGCVHRLRNPGKIALKIIEVQVGSYTGEDDIVRLEDVYARN